MEEYFHFISIFLILLFCTVSLSGPIPEDSDSLLKSNKLKPEEDVMSRIASINQGTGLELFQSDIVLHKNDTSQHTVSKRNARRSRRYIWANKKVPYEISQDLIDRWFGPTILKAIEEFHKGSCVRFVPRTTENNWLQFVREPGCWSAVGKVYWMPGAQKLSLGLGNGCNLTATVMHELLHALGFWHEQSRADRNLYVEILWENIQGGKEHNFMKQSYFETDNLDKAYDFHSLMHYGSKYFSKNGLDTIRSITNPDVKLGQRNGFSQLDIDEVNDLYDCNSTSAGWSSWSSFSPCNAKCDRKRERFCASSNAAMDCPGVSLDGVEEEIVPCSVLQCNASIDGHWGRWSPWSSCSTVCGPGTRSRARTCTDPVPRNGGKYCSGDEKEDMSCVYQSCGLGPNDCEFEVDVSGLCVWTQDDSDDMNWIRGQGPTPSSNTGPDGDHTSGRGHYLFIEASMPAVEGQRARLISKTFPGSNRSSCFILSYNMYGISMGSLDVFLENSEGRKSLLSKAGNQGPSWHTVHIDLQSHSDYQVIIEGIRGRDFRSDIAIDDVIFIPGSCSNTTMRNLGCYSDQTRPLSEFYTNVRSSIDWLDMKKTVKECAMAARQKDYKVFGVEFYGECWSSNKAKDVYNKDGRSNDCWNGVGKEWAYQAYELL